MSKYTIDDFVKVKDFIASCKGPVLIITPPVFAHQVIAPKLLKMFPKKSRVVAAGDIKPGQTEIPGDVIVICHEGISDALSARLPNHTTEGYLRPGHPKFKRRSPSHEARGLTLETLIQYMQVFEQHQAL